MEKKRALKKTVRDESEKRKLISRLNRIEGQVSGIRKMIESDRYTPEVLVQSSAVSAALKAFNKEILSDHLKNAVTKDLQNNKETSINELVKLINNTL